MIASLCRATHTEKTNSVCYSFGQQAVLFCAVYSVARYLAALEDVEHKRQANREKLLSVLVLLDGTEVSEQRQCDRGSGLYLGAAQRLQPHMQFPGHTCREHQRISSSVPSIPSTPPGRVQ